MKSWLGEDVRITKQEVLTKTRGLDSQARKSWLGQEVRITKQEVMARIGKVQIAMHWRLPKGISALDRELASILVGLGVWIDIDSKRAGYIGCVCTLEEFLINHRCWFCMLSNIYCLCIIEGFHTFQYGWVNIDSTR